MASLVSQRLGKYEIQSEIGRGGMAVVYRGYDPDLRRSVAIKVLASQLATDPDFVQRFRFEAITAANLRHPNIVTIHDVGSQGDIHYFVMEYLPGITLDEWLRQVGSLPLAQAVQIASQIGAALAYAHEQGIIHRDVKPANIMIDSKGHITLMDFGLVRAVEGSSLTRTGVVVGTPEYMAPEQVLGEALDARSDIYSFGIVIYRLLTGKVPFAQSTPFAVMYAHIQQPPPPLRQLRPDLPAAMEQVLSKALAKKPEDRYQQADHLVADLQAVLAGWPLAPGSAKGRPPAKGRSTSQPPASALPGSVPPKKRRSLAPVLMLVVAILIIGSIAGYQLLGGARPALPLGSQPTPTSVVASPPLIAEAPTATPSATATATPTATVTPSATPTETATPSPTLTATATATLTATPSPSPSPSFTPTITPSPTPFAIVKLDNVNIRAGPGVNYPIAEKVSTGAQLPVAFQTAKGDWARLVGAKELWISTSADLVTISGTVAITTYVPPPPAPSQRLPAPILLSPQDGYTAIGQKDTTFQWKWTGPALGSNQGFELRIWESSAVHSGAAPVVSYVANPDHVYSVTLGDLRTLPSVQHRHFDRLVLYWTVAVVQKSPYRRIGPEAPPRIVNS